MDLEGGPILKAVGYLFALFLLAACMSNVPQSGRTGGANFKSVKWNGAEPQFSEGVYTFAPGPGDCGAQTYEDGRGESDCNGGRVRSQIQAVGEIPVGREVEYSLDFWIPADFSYDGDRNYPA